MKKSYMTVSYTHLDVYKRQVMPGEMITEEIVMFLKNYRFLTIKVVK